MNIAHARVLLTGATGGIGRVIAHQLSAQGAALLLTGRDHAALETLATELRQVGGKVATVAADLTEATGRDRVAAAAARGSGVDVVIHNAGANVSGMFEDLAPEAIDTIVAANVTAPIQLTRLLLPTLRNQSEAMLLFMGSGFGAIGYPGFAAYSATKFALRGFAEALRRELADTAIAVVLLAPRAVDTPLNDSRVRSLHQAAKMSVDPPERIAVAVARLIHEPKNEVHIGWPERMFARLNRFAPGLIDNALRKQLPDIRRPLQADCATSASIRRSS
ncbi:SDR family oxidoreductase [Spectribacter hydrogenoxidans]|uniref:SDR family oxidoreductase n=1 Tax=Spectribacter hydrogenoxidans TaxID=3075608 RepID=A0ABU3C2U1_9GAMM|nr:SDR family oxidoreductase [Salinisphaera sp. W335]MDT0635878.1 SDR family oxidoreductase [Salinisphaera sp. W335]